MIALSRRSKGKGFTLIEVGIVLGIIAILAIIAGRYLAGSQQQTEWDNASALATTRIAGALQREMATRNTYARLTANAAGKDVIVRHGVEALTPWGAAWTVSTAGNATAVTITFPCAGAATPATWCAEIASRITAAANPMITSATVTGTNLAIAYRRPSAS